MQKNFNSNFEYGRKMVKILMIVTLICALAALILFSGNVAYQSVLLLASVIGIIATIYMMAKYCVCPHCGRHIIGGVLVVKSCPHCHRNLETGRKMKK